MHIVVIIVPNFFVEQYQWIFFPQRQTFIRTSRSGEKTHREAGEKYFLGKGKKLSVTATVNQIG